MTNPRPSSSPNPNTRLAYNFKNEFYDLNEDEREYLITKLIDRYTAELVYMDDEELMSEGKWQGII